MASLICLQVSISQVCAASTIIFCRNPGVRGKRMIKAGSGPQSLADRHTEKDNYLGDVCLMLTPFSVMSCVGSRKTSVPIQLPNDSLWKRCAPRKCECLVGPPATASIQVRGIRARIFHPPDIAGTNVVSTSRIPVCKFSCESVAV